MKLALTYATIDFYIKKILVVKSARSGVKPQNISLYIGLCPLKDFRFAWKINGENIKKFKKKGT